LRAKLWLLGRRANIPINQCVHYGGFRYGHDDPHPYETFVRLLKNSGDQRPAREWLIDFLRFYRPTALGEALGVKLSVSHPVWGFPWDSAVPLQDAWMNDPGKLPDIVTHYSAQGIPWERIEQEFGWLEQAFYSIKTRGFQPRLGPAMVVRRLVRIDGTIAFIVMDGNHRISALSTLGYSDIPVRWFPNGDVYESQLLCWPRVKIGYFSPTDALAVFESYFNGNHRWRIAPVAAPLIGCPRDLNK
jgi:hypothetical protein